jgi:hypothetical protein
MSVTHRGWQIGMELDDFESNLGTGLVRTMYLGSIPHDGGKDLLLLDCIIVS